MAPSGGSRRTFSRIPVRVEAEVRSGGGQIARGRVIDVSPRGVSLETDDALPPGEDCALDLLLAGGDPPVVIRLRGHVARRLHGMLAIALETIDPSGYEHFMKLLLYNAPNAHAFEAEMRARAHLQPPVAPTGVDEGLPDEA